MSRDLIKPQTLRGFRDFLPDAAALREAVTDVARGVFRGYGFGPIDTPALEYAEILLGKGGDETDKQTFRFTDNGGRDVALRFDLTVPFARFAAQHVGTLGTPFKRYHIAPVWRGERPQKGRYREFVQCDFDTIGTTGAAADAETVCVIHDLLAAISAGVTPSCGAFTIRISHRGVLNGLLRDVGLADRSTDVLRALDKLPKVGATQVLDELKEIASGNPRSGDAPVRLLALAEMSGHPKQLESNVRDMLLNKTEAAKAWERLKSIFTLAEAGGCDAGRLIVDLSIARGLDYYTGVIFETFLTDDPGLGSVCSGGRYDDLAGLYTKQSLPGVGASLGVDRLLAHLEEKAGSDRPRAGVFVPLLSDDRVADAFALAKELRDAGLAVTVSPEARALGKQLKRADGRGFRFAVILGEDEVGTGEVELKDLAAGTQERCSRADAVAIMSRAFGQT